MIIREEIVIQDNIMYRIYSDNNKYIKNTVDGLITTEITTIVPDNYIETDIEIVDELQDEEQVEVIEGG